MNSKYNIKFSSDAEKTLVKLDKTIARRIFMALEQLSSNPFENPNSKKMKGKEGNIYRLRGRKLSNYL